MGNSALLTQVFSNLLGNALKFVPPERDPQVNIRAEKFDGRVRVWVEDNGIGIEAGQQEKIFGLFQRLHRPDRFAGTGVGLAIVRKAIQRMGGSVGVESEPGAGCRFWIELPAANVL
jgi:signal transduction histidine kinase